MKNKHKSALVALGFHREAKHALRYLRRNNPDERFSMRQVRMALAFDKWNHIFEALKRKKVA